MSDATLLSDQLWLASLLIIVTSIMHLAGLGTLIHLVRMHRKLLLPHLQWLERPLTPLLLVLGLFVLHIAEISIWAFAYLRVRLVDTLEEALYVSTALYSTVGEGSIADVVQWRLLGAVEGLNGFLLIGWSTAFLLTVVNTLREQEQPLHERLQPDGLDDKTVGGSEKD